MTWGLQWGAPWGQAFAWGARENGDPMDVESPLVPIPVGEWNAVQTATDRIFKQWAQTETWPSIMEVIGELFGELDLVLAAVRMRRHRSTAEGVQLDEVGALVGRGRGSLSNDDDYRLAIMAEAWSQVSSGTGPQVVELVSALTDGGGRIQELPPAAFRVRVPDVTADRFALLSDIMSDMPGSGIAAVISTYRSSVVGGPSSRYSALAGESTGLVFRPRALDLVDPISGEAGVADGTTYVEASDARDFAGTTPGDRVDWQPGAADFAEAAWSVAGWVYFDSLANESRVWSSQVSSSSGSSFFMVDTSGRVRLFSFYATTSLDVRSSDTLSTGGWHHVAATIDGDGLAAGVRLFIDGVETAGYDVAIDSAGAGQGTDHLWSLGGREVNDLNNVDGRISDFRAWSRELTPAEVRHIHAQGVEGGFDGPPSSYEVATPAAFSSAHGASTVRSLFGTCRKIGD